MLHLITSGEKVVTTRIICARTAIVCASNADCHYIPTMMIFKRKHKNISLTHCTPVGTIQVCSENGLVNIGFFLNIYNPLLTMYNVP